MCKPNPEHYLTICIKIGAHTVNAFMGGHTGHKNQVIIVYGLRSSDISMKACLLLFFVRKHVCYSFSKDVRSEVGGRRTVLRLKSSTLCTGSFSLWMAWRTLHAISSGSRSSAEAFLSADVGLSTRLLVP